MTCSLCLTTSPKILFLTVFSQGASTSLRPHTTPRSTYLRSIQATNCSSCAPCTQPGISLWKESQQLKMARHWLETMTCSSTVPRPAPADNAAPPTKPAETNAETGETDKPGSTTRKGPCQGMLFRLPWFVKLRFFNGHHSHWFLHFHFLIMSLWSHGLAYLIGALQPWHCGPDGSFHEHGPSPRTVYPTTQT